LSASDQKFYNEIGVQLFNVNMTGLPIVLLAISDQDVADYLAEKFPEVYRDCLVII
jgi:hypothetical protein